MNIYDAVMKGPPRWFVRLIVFTMIFIVGQQVGVYRTASEQSAGAIRQRLEEKDRAIELLKTSLRKARFEIAIEREKLSILACESGIRHEGIWGDGGKSYGVAQFQYATFKDLRTQAGRPDLHWTNMQDQLWLLDWALRNGYGRYWTCYRRTR